MFMQKMTAPLYMYEEITDMDVNSSAERLDALWIIKLRYARKFTPEYSRIDYQKRVIINQHSVSYTENELANIYINELQSQKEEIELALKTLQTIKACLVDYAETPD